MDQGQVTEQPGNAVDAISAVLEREEPEFQKAQDRANNPVLEDDPPESEAKPEDKAEDKTEGKPETQEDSGAEQSEEEVSLDLDAPIIETKYKVEGGEDKVEKLSIKQLQQGFMRQQDYQRKTAELAKQREALQTEIEAKTKPAIENYEKHLTVMRQAVLAALAPELQGVNLVQLAQEDPAGYVTKQARLQQIGQLFQSIDSQLSKVQQAKAQEATLAKTKAIQEAVETLQRDIPDWGAEKYQELMKFGVESFDFTPQEIQETIDPRMFKLLDVARKYDALQKAKPEVEKKVAKVPKVLKPGTSDKNDKADRASEKWSRLNKDRSPEAAASVIYDMI